MIPLFLKWMSLTLCIISSLPMLAHSMKPYVLKQVASLTKGYSGQFVRAVSPLVSDLISQDPEPRNVHSPLLMMTNTLIFPEASHFPNIVIPKVSRSSILDMGPKTDFNYCPFTRGPGSAEAFEFFRANDRANSRFAPQLEDSDSDLSETLGEGKHVKLGSVMRTSPSSIIYAVELRDDMVLKYQSNCGSLHTVHPLLREYYFLKSIEELGISPVAFFVSAPALMTEEPTRKTLFDMDRAARDACVAKGGEVRFLAMERVGSSLYDVMTLTPRRRLPITIAIEFAALTIRSLEKLHALGIVHNDIHWGNVAIPREMPDVPRIKLIDFGRSIRRNARCPAIIRAPNTYATAHSSPWEIAGFHPGPRDDVYRTLLMLSMLEGGDIVWLFHHEMSRRSPLESGEYKQQPGNIFSHLSAGTDPTVIRHLETALSLVLLVRGVNDRVDYNAILKSLSRAVEAARNTS